jgi:hypothetical protein
VLVFDPVSMSNLLIWQSLIATEISSPILAHDNACLDQGATRAAFKLPAFAFAGGRHVDDGNLLLPSDGPG